jgi:MFS family permease
MELTNAISARSLKYPVWEVGVFKNKFLWYAVLSSFGLQMFVLYTPGIQTLFGVTSPEPVDWAFAILFTAITFGSLEIGKYIASKRREPRIPVEEIRGKPTAAIVLTLLGGILEIIFGITMSIGGLLTWFLGSIGVLFGLYWITLGSVIVIGAILIYYQPSSARSWGIVIIVLSVISGLNIFALIGGILAIVWKPRMPSPPPPPP